jgi:3-deoxy-7-phosphoheptulonate synthase
MIITLEPEASQATIDTIARQVDRYPGVKTKLYEFTGASTTIREVHLIGSTRTVPTEPFEVIPGVRAVSRVSVKYRLIGRHRDAQTHSFDYNGVRFGGDDVQIMAGLCAVDTPENVEAMMRAVQQNGLTATRMGAYKPRSSPYDFQGMGKECLPWVFDLAGKYGIKVIAMEITDARQIDEIDTALERAGNPTGVLLQVGTRNAQAFELLKVVGQQQRFPVLFKRGMGITLEESLNACEYIASEGNGKIIFCLRGVKTHLGDPHRNLVDFAHVPVVRRQTRLPVCIDPSHSVGRMDLAPDGLPDIFHVVGQGIVTGATAVLIDFHPKPEVALCDGPQALTLDQLPKFKRYVEVMHRAYRDAAS